VPPRNPPTPDTLAACCLSTRLRLLDRVVTSIYDDELRPLGVRVTQVSVLVAVWKTPGATASEIGRVLWIDASTLSRNLARVIERGWIVEDAAPDDGRARPLHLTPTGRRLVQRVVPMWEQAQSRARELLGQSATDAILAAGDRLMLTKMNDS